MISVRSFIFISSMILTLWLAASYTTKYEVKKPTPAAHKPKNESNINLSTATDSKQKDAPIVQLR